MNAVLLILLALLTSLSAAGSEPAVALDRSANILATLKERYPDVAFDRVRASTDLPGLYEVVTSTGIVYADAAGDRLITGYVTDTRSQQNLTEARWNELRAVDFASLPLNLAIKEVRGNGRRKLVVFSDPDCPFCQRLERQIEELDNVTLYTFLYPIDSLHPQAREKAVRIWCAADRVRVWGEWMRRKVEPAQATCADHPVEQLQALGQRLGIDATPTLFAEDGRRLEGAMTIPDLEGVFAQVQAEK